MDFLSVIGKDLLRVLMGSASAKCRAYIRLGQTARANEFPGLSRFCSRRLQRYGVYISPNADIHQSVRFPHPTSIVIGQGVIIDEGVRIFQGVTLGGARLGDYQAGNYPRIGKNTVVFAGAVLVGSIKIGNNCVIGANSVVLQDVPDNSVCVGAPARVIKKNT